MQDSFKEPYYHIFWGEVGLNPPLSRINLFVLEGSGYGRRQLRRLFSHACLARGRVSAILVLQSKHGGRVQGRNESSNIYGLLDKVTRREMKRTSHIKKIQLWSGVWPLWFGWYRMIGGFLTKPWRPVKQLPLQLRMHWNVCLQVRCVDMKLIGMELTRCCASVLRQAQMDAMYCS